MTTNKTGAHTAVNARELEILRALEPNGSRGRGQLPKGYLRLRRLGLLRQDGAGFYGWIITVTNEGRAAIAAATGGTP